MSRTTGTGSTLRRVARLVGWLVVGISGGILLGFAAGLARPRPNPSLAPDDREPS